MSELNFAKNAGLALVMNTVASEELAQKQREERQRLEEQQELEAIKNLSSYQKLEKELLPFLEAYLYAARKAKATTYQNGGLEIKADIENNLVAVSLRHVKTTKRADFFRYTVHDKGYYSVRKFDMDAYLNHEDFKLTHNDKYLSIEDVLKDLGKHVAYQNDDFKKYFRYYITNNDDTTVKCSREQPVPSISPKR